MRILALMGSAIMGISISITALGGTYSGTISDVHAHLKGGVELDGIIKQLKNSKVDRIVIMRRETERFDIGGNLQITEKDLIEFRNRFPERVLLGYGLQIARWESKDASLLDDIRKAAKSGNYSLIGEVTLRGGGGDGNVLFASPADPLFHKLLGVAAETGLPLMLHHTNIEPGELDQLKAALRTQPGVTVIWAHWCGLSEPEQVRSLFKEFPNLHCDLAWLRKKRSFEVDLVDDGFSFLPAWKKLIEESPERFLAGVDVTTDEHYEKYQKFVKRIRTALGGLSRGAARKVGSENFHRLLVRN